MDAVSVILFGVLELFISRQFLSVVVDGKASRFGDLGAGPFIWRLKDIRLLYWLQCKPSPTRLAIVSILAFELDLAKTCVPGAAGHRLESAHDDGLREGTRRI